MSTPALICLTGPKAGTLACHPGPRPVPPGCGEGRDQDGPTTTDGHADPGQAARDRYQGPGQGLALVCGGTSERHHGEQDLTRGLAQTADGSFVSLKDPDGNGGLVQEITTRLPGQ